METGIDAIARLARQANGRKEGDYEQDGLLYCGSCHTPKEAKIVLCGRLKVVSVTCKCASAEWEAKEEARKREEERLKLEGKREIWIADKHLRKSTFANANRSKLLDKCWRYADQWDKVQKENSGLLFYGDPGGGKTYAAACIANALIDNGIPAMITSFPRILAASWDDRADIVRQCKWFPLLVLDDLGAERSSDYALEVVYTVVNERYKSDKPLIVTTNMGLADMKSPKSIEYQRIYERILEMCVPVYVEPARYRAAEAERKLNIARDIFGGGG